MKIESRSIDTMAADGHRWHSLCRLPERARTALLWLPALGVGARHYEAFAEALAAQGIAVLLHEWRGIGSSGLRASRDLDWGYRELLEYDLPASQAVLRSVGAGLPLLAGGHSLGGQLACCHAAGQAEAYSALWLVASGTPYWRSFPGLRRYLLPAAYRFLPWLAHRNGSLPGRRIGFGGNEARGVIDDWSRVGLSDRYAARGMARDLEAELRALALPVEAVLLSGDWMAPASSLNALTGRMPGPTRTHLLSSARLGTRADHFSWMKRPASVAALLGGSLV